MFVKVHGVKRNPKYGENSKIKLLQGIKKVFNKKKKFYID